MACPLLTGQSAFSDVFRSMAPTPVTPWNATVLLVDDNEAARVLVTRYLGRSGFEGNVVHAETTAEAVTSLKAGVIDVVVTDHFFRGQPEGLRLVRHVRETHPGTPVVVFSSSDQLRNAAMEAGATAFVSTRDWDQIATCVRSLLPGAEPTEGTA